MCATMYIVAGSKKKQICQIVDILVSWFVGVFAHICYAHKVICMHQNNMEQALVFSVPSLVTRGNVLSKICVV